MVWADREQSARVVLGNFGIGHGIGRVLFRRGADRIRRWIPFPISTQEISDWILNQALRPQTVPTTVRDFFLQQAVAREALAEGLEKLQQQVQVNCELIVATGGGLARVPRWSQTVQILLDVLQPTGENPAGLVELYVDRSQILPSIGALATVNPDAAACVLLQDGLFHLGSCLVPLGRVKRGAKALDIELEFEGEMRQVVEIHWGQLVCIPFRWGEMAHLTVNPARGVRVGLGQRGERLTTKGGESIMSGALGLIIDARGRPLEIPDEDEERFLWLRDWFERCGGYTEEELASLIPPPEEVEEEEVREKEEVEEVLEEEAAVEVEVPEEEKLPWE
jgi:hypothetical protein